MTTDSKRTSSFFPKSLEACIEPLTRPLLKTQGLAGSRIVSQWDAIVGPQLAAHTLPEKLTFPQSNKQNGGKKIGGTLVISCENGFATELQHMQPQIMERLSGYFGYAAVSRIVISHSWVEKPQAPTPPAPRPTLSGDSVNLTHDIADGDLKAALQSLAKTLSGQKT